MNVGDRMSTNPFTIRKSESVSDARVMMQMQEIHRLPVVDEKGDLIGIVTEKDILFASPSPASTLNVWEITSLLARLTVGEVMSADPITCLPDSPIEIAARLMSRNNIGGLPVVDDGVLVGVITESDLFEVFLEIFDSRETGLRLTALMPHIKGELAAFAGAIRDAGGDILAFGTALGDKPTNRIGIVKVSGISEEGLLKAVKPHVLEVRDLRLLTWSEE